MDWSRLTYTLADFLRKCPGVCGEIARAIDASLPCSQPAISLPAALSFMAMIRSGRIQSEDGIEPPLYCAAIAPSGTGKTLAQNAIDELLEACGLYRNGMVEAVSHAGLLRALSEIPRRIMLWDEFGIALEELANTKASHRALMLSAIMKLYSKAGKLYRGQEYAERERIDIDSPYLSIFAVSTAIRFFEAMEEKFAHDGLLPRWLTFISTPDTGFQTKHPFVVQDRWVRVIEIISNGSAFKAGDLAIAKDAREKHIAKFDAFHAEADRRFQELYLKGDEFERIFWRRGYENYIKVAFAINDTVEEIRDTAFAFDLVEYVIREEIANFRTQLGAQSKRQKTKEKFFSLVGEKWTGHTVLMRRAQHLDASSIEKNQWINEAIEDLEIWEADYHNVNGSRKKSPLYRIRSAKNLH